MVFAIETIWYSVVALALSSPSPRARYLASKAWIDRTAGAIMSLLGLKLIFEVQQS
jgi:threonine/homoserine/homoserine lactone efflux protein